MKNVLRISLMVIFFTGALSSKGQLNLTIDASQNFTNFKFTDSQGEQDDRYKGKYLGGYDLGVKAHVFSDIYLKGSIGMRRFGASYITNEVNSEWDLQYMHLELGLIYQHQFESISLFASVSPFYENLIKGNQRLLDINYDVVANKSMNTTNFGLAYQGGILTKVNDHFNIKTAAQYAHGFTNLESKGSTQETTTYSMGLTLGVEFIIF